jgi:NAD(P)-dependent dehydrogenase (short-subunit alcohol dehydrogenase family)
LQANHKVYDATTQATLTTSGASVSGVVPGDAVTVSLSGATGIFADMNAGNGIAVTVSGVANALTAGAGTSLSNYSLVPVGSLSANITPAPLTITGMTAASFVRDDIAALWAKKAALKRLGQPIDIARAALFLASDDGGFVTGQALGVDGGLMLRV